MANSAALEVGERIRLARTERGLSQEQLAHQVNRRQATISDWEQGRTSPGLDDLYALGAALDRDVHFFLPARLEPPPKAITRAISEALPLGARLQGSLQLFFQVAGVTPQPEKRIDIAATQAEECATELLRKAKVKQAPVDVEQLAMACGSRVIAWEAMDDALSGLLVELGDGPLIAYNARHPHGRQRFTIAHELGHLLLGHLKTFHVDLTTQEAVESRPGYSRAHEKAANAFAAELLMPSAWVHKAVNGSSVEQLADRFGVSDVAMGFRLMGLGLAGSEG